MRNIRWIHWFFTSPEIQAQRGRQIAKLVFLLSLFIVLFYIIPLQSVLQAIFLADPLLFCVGFVLSVISTVFGVLQLEPLTRNQGIKHGLKQLLLVNLAVKFYLQFTPSTLVAGGIRWYRLAKPENKKAEALAAVAFYRLFETFLTIVLGLGFWLLSGREAVELSLGWIGAIVFAILVFWLLATRLSKPIYVWFLGQTERSPRLVFLQPILERLEKFFFALSAYASMPVWDLLVSITAGVVAQLIGILSNVYVAKALGIQLSFLEHGWIASLINLTTQLPFAVAGGLGFREVTLVAILPAYGVNANLAIAFSFLLFARGILISLIGGIFEAVELLRIKQAA